MTQHILFGNTIHPKYVPKEAFTEELKVWFLSEMENPKIKSDARLLTGCPIWGTEYIERFEKWCLPSMLSKYNKPALAGRALLLFYTDDCTTFDGIKSTLEAAGIECVVREIPPHIMKSVREEYFNRFQLLGTIQTLLVQIAGHSDMGFHVMFPDVLYGHKYFPNMFDIAQDHDGLVQSTICCDITKARCEFEKHRQSDGTLLIEDRVLGDIAYRNIHKQTALRQIKTMDVTVDDFPASHYVFWVAQDRLYIYSPHTNPVYLSPRLCARAPIRLFNAIDVELPYIMTGRIGFVTAESGMAFVEFATDNKKYLDGRTSFIEFLMHCWSSVHFKKDYDLFFSTPNTMLIGKQKKYLDRREIINQHGYIFQSMKTMHAPLKAALEKIDSGAFDKPVTIQEALSSLE